LGGGCGLSAASRAAALANSSRKGWWLANITRTRRVLRRIAAPIFSSRMRMVAAPARCSSVSCSAKARDIWGASFKTLEEATACFYERQADLERGIVPEMPKHQD
jgi:hypothetical protein